MNTLRELFLAPKNAATFPPERLTKLEQALVDDHQSDMPWYLRLIVGIGAWLASLFFLGCIFALVGWEGKNEATIGTIGAVLLVGAVAVGRQKWGVFAEQGALAVSLAAQVMLYIGIVDEQSHPLRTAMMLSIVLAAILYAAFPSFLSRLMTCFAALQVTLSWILGGDHGDPVFGVMRASEYYPMLTLIFWAFHLAGICWTLLRPRQAILFAPLGYALVASMAVWQVEQLWHFWESVSVGNYQFSVWMWMAFRLRAVLTALALFGVAVWAAGGRNVLREKTRVFLGVGAVLSVLVYLGLNSILLALLFLLIGFSLQAKPILTLGLVLLPVFLAQYYYDLRLDLLVKSGVLVLSGVLLLMLRSGLARGLFVERETA